MNRIFKIITVLVLGVLPLSVYAQMNIEDLHGQDREIRNGLHAGNLFRTTFYNDGTYGSVVSGVDIAGEWPINSGHIYLIDGNPFVGAEVRDTEGQLKHIMSTCRSSQVSYSTGDTGPNGEWWTFLPLPGFANADTNKIAMTKWPWSWPAQWPDKMNDPDDPGWVGSWNGYFGKNQTNAKEESYFVADDYNNAEFLFYPDSLDENRRGLGLRLYVRGFQWANALVEDGLFVLCDIKNVGTYNHDKMVFGYKVGNDMGSTMTANDAGDDSGSFNKDEDIAFLYDDYDDFADGSIGVGYFGGAFLESPGNANDGIDNDNDGAAGGGDVITEAMFLPIELQDGQQIIRIDYETFERTEETMTADTLEIEFGNIVYRFWPGKQMVEVPFNLFDDNLNGLIDESNGATFGEEGAEITTYLYVGQKCKNYLTGAGLNNLMIDEARDDGIDNDGDWEEKDDVGYDGTPYTNDSGEEDGLLTDGEPHFDRTDIDETDMLGLTSFALYRWETVPHYSDELVWEKLIPGLFDEQLNSQNVELFWGSGYFPLKAGQTERFSMALICGTNEQDLIRNKYWFGEAYNRNYQFAKAPDIPIVTAIPGDNRVALYWDDLAEYSEDPISGRDFEGYRIYRSTDPGWNDMKALTDFYGVETSIRVPLAQFDIKDNGYQGSAAVDIEGVHFWLGDNTGLVHSFVDTTAKNGFEYYYAVTSYDHGAPDKGIPPTECTKSISIYTTGEIVKGPNVIIARPEARAAGYMAADTTESGWLPGSTTSGGVFMKIIDPNLIQDRTYQVVFEDTLMQNGVYMYPYTKSFSWLDVTDPANPVTLVDKDTLYNGEELPLIHGIKLNVVNDEDLGANEDESGFAGADGVVNPNLNIYEYLWRPFRQGSNVGTPVAHDYMIIWGDPGISTTVEFDVSSSTHLEAVETNVDVINLITGEEIAFALYERDGEDGNFTAFTDGTRSDRLIFMEENSEGELIPTWSFEFTTSNSDDLTRIPRIGERVILYQYKPFLSNDVYQFKTKAQKADPEVAKAALENIRVVPNPYIVANSWEPKNPYGSGRGPRELHFIHLPSQCTIRIYNIKGQLVDTIEHNAFQSDDENPDLWTGTAIWNMLSKDELSISFGVYVYHVDAGDLGEKIGKFAIIK